MSSSLPAVVFQYLAWLVAGPATAAVLCWAMVAKPAAATGPPVQALVWLLAGIACGELLAGQQKHPTRILGFVPYGASGLVMAFALRAVFVSAPAWLCVWLGVMCGIIVVPLLATDEVRLRGTSIFILCLLGMSLGVVLWPRERFWVMTAVAASGAAIAWRAFLRDAYELTVECLTWPFFRIHGHGPGIGRIPSHGPLLVIANHTAWFDPIWIAKVLPRRLTGMLTSLFFDLPVLHFLATKVVPTIRVEESRYRREAPELAQAMAALDRGEAVLLFPEGQMRKREDKPLHPFGRGVWHILHERPQTPVVVCWIEGGWGSYASYRGGPPTKNKRFDWWRRIDVAVCEPEVLDASLLEDHRATRNYLLQHVLNARRHLGLEPLGQLELAHSSEVEE